jgi:Arc/MetJ-type ribon-helix-helix transcriptional regulator
MGRPAKIIRRKKTSVRLSQRDEWFVGELIKQAIYGDNATEIIRHGLRLLVKKAQDENRMPRAQLASWDDIPLADPHDPNETN